MLLRPPHFNFARRVSTCANNFLRPQAASIVLSEYREAAPNTRIFGGVSERRSPLGLILEPSKLLPAQVRRSLLVVLAV